MERLPMRKIKDVLRLSASGCSIRRIAQSVGISRPSVSTYLTRAADAGLSWPDVQSIRQNPFKGNATVTARTFELF